VSRTLYVDAFAGIAGDMWVAALIDAGADLSTVLSGVEALGVPGWTATVERAQRGPFAAARFFVDAAPSPPRDWAEIRALLSAAPWPGRARDRALRCFGDLAAAESRVHGIPVEEVHFHEVGAVDSIVDVAAACLALDALDVDRVVGSALPLGGGVVLTQHGVMPLPAPATIELLRGWPVHGADWPGELVTPTGAALLAAVGEPGPMPPMRVAAIGYGAGTRDPPSHPNVLRVLLGEGWAGASGEIVELRSTIDTLPGEAVPALLEAVMAAGAVDAHVLSGVGKKGRPVLELVAICEPASRAAVTDAVLRHGATLGVRWTRMEREVVARRWETVGVAGGTVRIKVGERGGQVLHAVPEFEDVAVLARATGRSVHEIQAESLRTWAVPRRRPAG
jgi:uncharacterized protein (TIGR00299 family) protein